MGDLLSVVNHLGVSDIQPGRYIEYLLMSKRAHHAMYYPRIRRLTM